MAVRMVYECDRCGKERSRAVHLEDWFQIELSDPVCVNYDDVVFHLCDDCAPHRLAKWVGTSGHTLTAKSDD